MSEAVGRRPLGIDTSRPSIARVYDAMLGGKDNFAVDRELLAHLEQTAPEIRDLARANRAWLTRAVRWLAQDAGVDQFLDIGSGLPTNENTHQVAQRVDSDATVIYVDNDPVVSAHGRALLEDNDHTLFINGDLTRPDEVLGDPALVRLLDFDRPIALLQCMTLHHLPDTEAVRQLMARYIAALPSGSYVGITHGERPYHEDAEDDRILTTARDAEAVSSGFTLRTRDEIRSLLPGLELVEPGLVPVNEWWPEGPRLEDDGYMVQLLIGVVARKP